MCYGYSENRFVSVNYILQRHACQFVSDRLNYVSGVSSSPQENSHHASSSHPHPNRTSEMVSCSASGLCDQLVGVKEALYN
jgi:hypothetical protein